MPLISKSRRQRTKRGAAITEFSTALTVFTCFFVAIVDLAFVPARYLLVHTSLENVVHQLALSEKRTEAVQYLDNDANWKKKVESFGVTVKGAKIGMLILDNSGDTKLSLDGTAPVPKQWLPNNDKVPHVYALELSCDVDIPPLFKGGIGGIPGFNKPITFKIKNRSQWENLSPDPLTGQYYINE